MKSLFVINPVSGTKSLQRRIPEFIHKLECLDIMEQVDSYYTEDIKHDALNKVMSLEKGMYDLIIAVGGDGTVNEVVTGIVNGQLDASLAVIPAGTVNDFGNFLNLPTNPSEFAQMIEKGHTEAIDVGLIDNRCFINVVSGGMFSDIGFQVTKEEKNTFGPLAYYVKGLQSLNVELNKEFSLKITTEKEMIKENACLFLITNTSSVGGFKDITPLASIQDGMLDLMIIKKTDILDLISIFKDYSLFYHNHLEHPSIRYIQAKQFLIESENDLVYDIDGEKGTTLPINIECKKDAVFIYTNEND